METAIFGLRTAANREDQVVDYLISKLYKATDAGILAVIRPHGMRGYIFVEATSKAAAEAILQGVPYARGLLATAIPYEEIEHMLAQIKVEMNIQKSDIVEIISGPFKREQAKVMRINQQKEEIVVELLEAAVPIPITVKMDAVKVIRRESEEEEKEEK
ncbi:MAG TPA: transcription elongation factor Spt5 [Candidatus Nanoarchaeia archaeon]|nr:transcription elongation factor Spt5 [Candidatus Nanoarchaeia archaeon]